MRIRRSPIISFIKAIKQAGFTQRGVARKLGIKINRFSNCLHGDASFSPKEFELVSDFMEELSKNENTNIRQ